MQEVLGMDSKSLCSSGYASEYSYCTIVITCCAVWCCYVMIGNTHPQWARAISISFEPVWSSGKALGW